MYDLETICEMLGIFQAYEQKKVMLFVDKVDFDMEKEYSICIGTHQPLNSEDVPRNLYTYRPMGAYNDWIFVLSKNVRFYTWNGPRDIISIQNHYHTHFSGYVKYQTILEELEGKMSISENGRELSVRYDDTEIPSHPWNKLNGKSFNMKIVEMIHNAWRNRRMRFAILGALFYGIIKDVRFLPTYCRLMVEQMENEGANHLFCRLKLGGVFGPDQESISISKELDIIEKNTFGKVSIIAQDNRHRDLSTLVRYFSSIEELDRDVIVGYDLTGKEKDMNYRKFSTLFSTVMKKPWFLHIGEGKFFRKNMKSIDYLNITRVGHGISAFRDNSLQKKYVFELTPIGYYCEGTLNLNEIVNLFKDFIKNSTLFTISSDDTNKYFDQDLQDNYIFLRGIGLDIDPIIHISKNV